MRRGSALVRRRANLRGIAVVIGLLIVVGNPLSIGVSHAATLPTGFADRVVLSGLTQPTNVEFSPDGRVFVAEKSGLIKVFPSLTATTPTVFADLRGVVNSYWDRGLLGLALDPQFPAQPYMYVLYTYDHIIGDPAPPPKWNDGCPTPPGGGTDGCVVSARLSRLTAGGNTMLPGGERVLVEGWCQQFQTHSIGDLAFGPDGALYVSAGDGAAAGPIDYGQLGGTYSGDKANPCGDPPSPAGTALQPPSAQGGVLRSQSPRRPTNQPRVLNGTILRVDPDSGAGLPDNPLAASLDANAKRIVAYGLRNPFRFTLRPGTREVWVGDVGWSAWEEIDRIADPTARLTNFGWPCYEGSGRQSSYDAANLSGCESLYTSGGVTAPYYAYNHAGGVVSGDGCPTSGTASSSGVAFYQSGAYPSRYNGALFFADYSRKCIWAMLKGTNGLPDPNQRQRLVTAAASPVDLQTGPAGDLFYTDLLGGKIHRIVYTSGNQAPIAVASAAPTSGSAPLTVNFDGSGSSDPDTGDTISYAWDFTSDGHVDSTSAQASFTYQANGQYLATLQVTDTHGGSSTDAVAITVGNTPPVVTIDTPVPSLTWKVGEAVNFSGHASDGEDGTLPASSLTWSLALHHCATATSCHTHPLEDFPGVSGGSFAAPDHEYPSWLELSLTATDSGGLRDAVSVRVDPRTVNLTFASSPSGLQLAVGSQTAKAPFTRTVIVGSANSVSAPEPQTLNGVAYAFNSWSDHGAPSHTLTAPAQPTTYTARYVKYTPASFNLRNSNTAGFPDARFQYGKVGDIPVAGDWNGDGIDTPGLFRDGYWYLRNSNSAGPYDIVFSYGNIGDRPVVGDWNNDGVDTIGVFHAGGWNLRNSNSFGLPSVRISYGTTGDIPVVGDWNNDEVDTIGVFRAGVWYLRNSNSTGPSNVKFSYGNTGDVPVTGDWNGDGTDTIGVFHAGGWNLRDSNSPGLPSVRISYGTSSDAVVTGDWNNDSLDTIGTFR
ncbi:MAG: PQQ-dependent sugar dehydrogenase [Actinomycetes bacterium]